MRLTLRTLLAYLDEILEAEDAQELQRKIQESEVASQLVHRIRHVVGQLGGDAPSLRAEGLGKDANSVAEYLDNTLPPEKIAEFERICLESDDHLAEVAACHQILTLVLGEPADIVPQLKQRIYQLPNPSGLPKHAGEAGPLPPENESASPVPTHRGEAPPVQPLTSAPSPPVRLKSDEDEHWTEAPDYLKRPRASRWKPLVIAAAIAFLLVLAGIRGMGPLNRSHPLAQRLGFGPPTVAQNSATDASVDQRSETLRSEDNLADVPETASAGAEPPSDEMATDAPTTAVPDLQGPTSQEPSEPFQPEGDLQSAIPGGDEPIFEELEDTGSMDIDPGTGEFDPSDDTAAQDPIDGGESLLADDGFANEPSGVPIEDATPEPEDAETADAPALINPLATRLPDNDSDATPVPALPTPPSPMDLPGEDGSETSDRPDSSPGPPQTVEAGRFLSEDQLLLRYDPQSQLWSRLPSRAPLLVGDQLQALPTYRPQLMLPTGMQLTLVGPGQARLQTPDADETPQVQIDFGRVAVVTFARAGTRFGISWGNRSAVAAFADMDTTLSMQISRELVPGTDPIEQAAHVVLRVYPTSGRIEWQVADAPAIQVASGQRLLMIDDAPPRLDTIAEMPEWIDGRDARPRDPIAARGLEPNVTSDRSAALSLKEQADSKRLEVRSLAACSLAYLGDFDSLLLALNDNMLKAYWSDQYQTLKECLMLDRAVASQIRDGLVQRHGEEGEELFRILWGYSSQQLADGGAEDLVRFLDHPSSDFRIAAIETLKSITGTPSLYLPHFTEAQRRSAVFKWREKLQQSQIRYSELPEIVRLLENEPAAP